jgi:hypothetical protein
VNDAGRLRAQRNRPMYEPRPSTTTPPGPRYGDVDLLVEFAPGEKSYRRFMDLYDLMEELFEQRVELLTTESLSPYIGPHILAEARDIVLTEAMQGLI